jgi:hypothetical protein
MPNGIIRIELLIKKYLSIWRLYLDTNQAPICIFCGGTTLEQHETRIGFIHIHVGCLVDLQEIFSSTMEEDEELEEIKMT